MRKAEQRLARGAFPGAGVRCPPAQTRLLANDSPWRNGRGGGGARARQTGGENTANGMRDYGKPGDFATKSGRESTGKRRENASNFRNLARERGLKREGAASGGVGGEKRRQRGGGDGTASRGTGRRAAGRAATAPQRTGRAHPFPIPPAPSLGYRFGRSGPVSRRGRGGGGFRWRPTGSGRRCRGEFAGPFP